MDAKFWIDAWNEGRTAFHQAHFNDKLLQYFPRLNPETAQRVLVPLCGKSKDMLWLSGLGLRVHGVELHEEAVVSFFRENNLPAPERNQDPDFTHFNEGNIQISCGDFFKLNPSPSASYDFIYDRAALVALPAPMRKNYAQVVQRALKPGGKYLLIVFEYDSSQLEGPPFSVTAEEIQLLFGDQLMIRLLESQRPTQESPRLAALGELKQNVYLLEKPR